MIQLNISYINETENTREYDETNTFPTLKEAKIWIKENIGKRPKSGMYVDLKDGSSKRIGSVYSRYQQYFEPTGKGYNNKRYVQSIWIEFFTVERLKFKGDG